MPTFETNVTYQDAMHYVLNASSDNKENAKKVLEYLVSPEGQLAYTDFTGYVPMYFSVTFWIKNPTLAVAPMFPHCANTLNLAPYPVLWYPRLWNILQKLEQSSKSMLLTRSLWSRPLNAHRLPMRKWFLELNEFEGITIAGRTCRIR